MQYTREELAEARRQIGSTLHKLREAVRTLEGRENPVRYKSQITLAKRRIQAFTIADDLIARELGAGAAAQAAAQAMQAHKEKRV